MDIIYKIEFFSEWHCGSGLSAGADTDALVIKDKDGFPYIPGKTLKGLFREAIEDLMSFNSYTNEKKRIFYKTFGYFHDDKSKAEKGCIFFTNAELEQKEAIKKVQAQHYLFRQITTTAIENGTAVPNSLRCMETVIPCTLTGKILEVDESLKNIIRDAALFIKRLGQNRNRGLGRCAIYIESK